MIRATLRGSAASAACAFVTASVSGSERYSTPAGDRYWTDCAPVWTAPGAGPNAIATPKHERQRGAPHYFTPAFALSSSNQLTMTLSRVGCESGSVLMKTKRFPSGDAAKS